MISLEQIGASLLLGYEDTTLITARCSIMQSAVLRSHVVCLSVCPSVTLVNC